MEVESLVKSYFNLSTKCYGHCQEEAKPVFKKMNDTVISFIVCPGMYVSRIIAYNSSQDFVNYLRKILDGMSLNSQDVRVATRYNWDLGINESKELRLRVSYWTQNYGKSKVESVDRDALFLCSSCLNPFVKKLNETRELCSSCLS